MKIIMMLITARNLLLIVIIQFLLGACTAINMQSFYKPELSEHISIQDKKVKQENPTPPAFFISFADNHIYEFSYNDLLFEVFSPLYTDPSTLVGPLLFPIFPSSLINEIFFPKPLHNFIEIHVHNEKNQYGQERIKNIALLDLDHSTMIFPQIDNSSSASLYSLIYKFDGKFPLRFKLLLDPISSDSTASPQVMFRKVYRPSFSAGVW